MKIVVKVGGSVLFPAEGPDKSYIRKLLPVLKKIKKKNQMIFCVGAGKYFRNFGYNVKGFLSNKDVEWVFIDLLKVNVNLFSKLLGMKPIKSLVEIRKNTSGVIGGIKPGRSTDANAAYAAKKISADFFVKMTDVNGIYDKDPKKYKNAKLLESINFKDLLKYSVKESPGKYGILDKTAMKYIARGKIKTIVMNGKDPKRLLEVLKGKKIGTEIL